LPEEANEVTRQTAAVAALLTAGAWLALADRGNAQPVQAARPQLAEDVFKNVQILRGIPVDEFMDTMGMFSAATGLNCTNCHAADNSTSWDSYAVDTRLKQTARRMLRIVNAINKDSFGGARAITCYTCHRGDQRPRVVPNLAVQYSAPAEDPNEVEAFRTPGLPPAEQVFDKYFQALGGTQRLEALTTMVARGTYAGYDTEQAKVPVDIFAKAPAARTIIVHARFGDSVRTYDGRDAWIASADRPLLLMPLTGGNLMGARVDALLGFPLALKQAFGQWQVGATTLDDHDVLVLQGVTQGQPPLNLYFDESGLLVRMLRFTDTTVGRVPTQVDVSDYREIGGVKIPFRWTTTWTDGRSTVELDDAQINVPVDSTKFARPQPARALK
jgi:photosynthetic reaction center cytochrome c subunit